jgi:hypothetical protein
MVQSVPSSKPRLQAYVSQEVLDRVKHLANNDDGIHDVSALVDQTLQNALSPNAVIANLSNDTYELLKQSAQENMRTIEQQAVFLLTQCLKNKD